MRNKFRIDDFEAVNLEKAQKILDKRLKNLLGYVPEENVVTIKESAWTQIMSRLKKLFSRS